MAEGMRTELGSPRFVESESATTNHEQNHAGSAPVIVTIAVVGCLMLLMFALTNLVGAAVQSQLRYSLMSPDARSMTFDDELLELMDDDFGYGPYDFDEDWWSSSAELRTC